MPAEAATGSTVRRQASRMAAKWKGRLGKFGIGILGYPVRAVLAAIKPPFIRLRVEVDGEVVGMAVWYLTFSTWTGVNGIWLEDLFVQPGQRGSGLGRELLATLARTCVERGYQRLEWWVLDWNEPSIGFYESLGARAQDEWTVFRMDGAALGELGA